MVKFPEVEVQLSGSDGNAFAIIGAVSKVLRSEVSPEAAKEFSAEAMESESYDDLLQLVMSTVEVV